MHCLPLPIEIPMLLKDLLFIVRRWSLRRATEGRCWFMTAKFTYPTQESPARQTRAARL